jgi:hypothetical protein
MRMRGFDSISLFGGCIGYRIVIVSYRGFYLLAAALAYTLAGPHVPMYLPPATLLSTTAFPALCCVLLKSTLKFREFGELGLRKRKRKKENPPT